MNGTELLCELFANVPDPTEKIGKAGGRIGSAIIQATGAIALPFDWLKAYGIPIVQAQDCEIPVGVAGLFYPVPPRVVIPLDVNANSPGVMRTIWHEVGHAADFVMSVEGKITPTPHGQFSSRHAGLLREHQEVIITWNPHPDRDYKTKLVELWAETVTQAITQPVLMPTALLVGVLPDLEFLRLPTDKAKAVIAALKETMSTPAPVDKEAEALKALKILGEFIGTAQLKTVREAMRGEEREFFFDKMIELAAVVTAMPTSGETDKQGDAAVARLHYFAGGSANWYITEKDVLAQQHQAFGLADLFADGGELGYISITEIIANNGELDFHWTPKTLGEIRSGRDKDAPDAFAGPVIVAAPGPKSFKSEMEVGREWAANAMRYATEKEAEAAGLELMSRWMSASNHRVVPSDDAVNARFNFETGRPELIEVSA